MVHSDQGGSLDPPEKAPGPEKLVKKPKKFWGGYPPLPQTDLMVDIGGGDNDDTNDASEDVPLGEVSSFPLTDVMTTLSLCFQEADLAALDTKKRKSKSDVSLQALHSTYASLWHHLSFTPR